jgi:HSP20 family protein
LTYKLARPLLFDMAEQRITYMDGTKKRRIETEQGGIAMKLVKYNTYNPIDRVFDNLTRGWFPSIQEFLGEESRWPAANDLRLPRTNISESDNSFVFTLEMPGLTKKDVEVSLEDDNLVVKGERTEKQEDKGLLRREIRSEKYERSFRLGNAIEQDQIKAKMENGVLTLTLPKKPEKVGRKVDVD